MSKILKLVLTFAVLAATPIPATAQVGGSQGLTQQERSELTGTRKQLATIVFAGLAGAILGLSTLSFYGRPQEHLTNIAIGGALGVIAGASFTTYKAATKPYEVYDLGGESFAPTQGFAARGEREYFDKKLDFKPLHLAWNF